MTSSRGRKGFVYTLFAILVLGLTLNITLLPLTVESPSGTGEKLRVDEVFYFLQSVESDFDRATGIIGRRAMTSLSNRIVNNGSYLNDSREAFRESFSDGTIEGIPAPLMNRSSFSDWSESMEDEAGNSGYNLSTSLASISLGSSPPITMTLNASYEFNLSDDITDSRFERARNVSLEVSFQGVEDPLILVESAGRYTNFFSACTTSTPAELHSSGGGWFYEEAQNWTSGETVVRPDNGPVAGVSGKGNKIAVVNDLCSYGDLSDFTGFSGVVSESEAIDGKRPNNRVDVCGQNNVNLNAVVDDATGATQIGSGSMSVITDDEVWQNNLKNRTEDACYFSDPWAPKVWERLEGRMTNRGGKGTAFLLTVPDLPSELQDEDGSAVAYVYFNDSADFGDTHKVKGVTNEGMNWFRLDQQHIDEWSINALTYD